MQVTCSCGKKLYFGNDPDEVQVCSRCGQSISASGPGPPPPPPPPPPRSSPPSRGSGGGGGPPPPRPPRGGPPISARERPKIAGKTEMKIHVGCLLFALVAIIAAFVIDFFVVYPNRTLRCGHEGKESYVFGALPFGHVCEPLKAIWFMEAVRRAYVDGISMPTHVDAISARANLGDPPGSYDVEMFDDESLRAEPLDDPNLPTVSMTVDGEITLE